LPGNNRRGSFRLGFGGAIVSTVAMRKETTVEGDAMKQALKIAAIGFAALLTAGAASAAEIKVITSVGVKAILEELAPAFERTSGHKLKITYGTAVPLKRQIDSGETFDVVILVPGMIDDLTKQGKIAAGTNANVAKSGIGVAIKQGAPKPDVSSTDAFKKTLLATKSIAYSKEGQSGAAMARIMERIGIAAEMAPKTILETRPGGVALNVVEGKADLAFNLISEILPVAGAELVGPLPAELQSYVIFTSGIGSTSKEAAATKAFVDFLKAPAAVPVLKAKGMEPG
jgi:molybdate transport system substrate-binding protein